MNMRVILADDHDLVRAGIRAVLQKLPGIEVIAEAVDGRAAVQLAQELAPDLVLMDIGMANLNGVDATRQILAEKEGPRVIVLSMHEDQQVITDVLKAGASGYLLKNCAARELPEAVRAVAAGKVYLSPRIAHLVVQDYVRHLPENSGDAAGPLTQREREVLQLLAEGKTSKEMAAALHVSPKTIESYRAQIMEKLHIRTIAGLTKFAIRQGITGLDN